MAKLNPCALCLKNPRHAGSAACKKCLQDLQNEQLGLKPGETICDICANTVSSAGSNICSKCANKDSARQPNTRRAKKERHTPIHPGSNADKVYRFLAAAKGYVSASKIVSSTKLSDSTVRSILFTSLRNKIIDDGHDNYKLKSIYLRDDVNQAIHGILFGAAITEQIDRMMK